MIGIRFVKRRKLRILVSPSRSNFFIAKDRVRGFEYEIFQQLEKHLRDYANLVDFQVEYIPVSHDQLIPMLNKGCGDVAAAMLTITSDREKLVDFTSPYIENIDEILIRNKKADRILSLNDLSGKDFCCCWNNYLSSLRKFNDQLKSQDLDPIQINSVKNLNTEDILEMLNSGIYEYTIADRPIGELWQQVLPNIELNEKVKLGENKKIAWAVRKNNPELKRELSLHAQRKRRGKFARKYIFKRYYQQAHWLGITLNEDFGRFNKYKHIFKEAGEKYNFDWILIAMQAYQESRFIANAKSHAGARGIITVINAIYRKGFKNK